MSVANERESQQQFPMQPQYGLSLMESLCGSICIGDEALVEIADDGESVRCEQESAVE